MRKKLVQYTVVLVMTTLCGCARKPAETVARAPVPVTAAVKVEKPAGGSAGNEEPAAPLTRQELEQAAPQSEWEIPEGKLDDAKFVAVSARYLAAVLRLPEARRSADNMLLALEEALFDAHVTVEEYKAYAGKVSADAGRKKRLGKRIVKLVVERTGIKVGVDSVQLPGESRVQIKGEQVAP